MRFGGQGGGGGIVIELRGPFVDLAGAGAALGGFAAGRGDLLGSDGRAGGEAVVVVAHFGAAVHGGGHGLTHGCFEIGLEGAALAEALQHGVVIGEGDAAGGGECADPCAVHIAKVKFARIDGIEKCQAIEIRAEHFRAVLGDDPGKIGERLGAGKLVLNHDGAIAADLDGLGPFHRH